MLLTARLQTLSFVNLAIDSNQSTLTTIGKKDDHGVTMQVPVKRTSFRF